MWPQGEGALYRAAFYGFDKIVNILLEAHADPNAKEKSKLFTPLHAAAYNGHHTCVYDLLLKKAEVSPRDSNNATPLHQASTAGRTDIIELLLSAGADVDAVGDVGRTSLLCASVGGHTKACELLLEAGSDPHKLDADGRNSVFIAGNVEVLRVLLDKGASAKVRDNCGQTPLHYACRWGASGGLLCAKYIKPELTQR